MWVQHAETLVCPCCYNEHHPLLDKVEFRPPNSVLLDVLGSLVVACNKGCQTLVKAKDVKKHIASGCKGYVMAQQNSPSRTTIRDVLSRPADTPTTPLEKRAAENLIHRLQAESDERIVRIPTRGQVTKYTHTHVYIMYMVDIDVHVHCTCNYKCTCTFQPISLVQVSSCRVPSSLATSKTVRRRSQQLTRVRAHVCGGEMEVQVQLQDELKSLSKKEREDLLKDASLPIEIPTEHALAMKADLAISWNKLRTVRRYTCTCTCTCTYNYILYTM